VSRCAALDAVLSGDAELSAAGPLTFGVPRNLVLDGLDAHVSKAFSRALNRLSAAGIAIQEIAFPELDAIPEINRRGGLAAFEAHSIHRETVARHRDRMDPRVVQRLLQGAELTEDDARDIRTRRAALIESSRAVTAPFDALIFPTVPIIAPAFAELQRDDDYYRINGLVLRNASVANFLDRCALSIPMHEPGAPPSGLTLLGENGADRRLLAAGIAIERLIAPTAAAG
jgi:aspartyl-tRNA(Asn)/glutamyl-tRNA(Gln) amidotransferase subunit A